MNAQVLMVSDYKKNEVEAHKNHYPDNILIVVHSTDLDRTEEPPKPRGGVVKRIQPWKLAEGNLQPLSLMYQIGGGE